MCNYDEWKLASPPDTEDEVEYINCELCNDVISVDELEILTPIINQHFKEQIVCKECFKLNTNES